MENIEKIRHSLAHIMAMAVKELYPDVKIAIGPAIDDGFYYDFDFPTKSLTEADLKEIQKLMKKICSRDLKFEKEIISRKKALELFKDEPYKLELINNIEDGEEISIYKSGDFVDLCAGPHVDSSKEIKPDSFVLDRLAGAYWLGDEKNKMLTRIYGLAFLSKEDLNDYLKRREEALKRDHRIIGQKMDLFHIDEKLGPGLILWHPKGARLKKIIERYAEDKYLANGFQLICSPHLAKINLWNTSGHTGFYSDSMYPPIHLGEKEGAEKEDYQIKPMNCPFHILAYQNDLRSYRDLPVRYCELGTVYRYEKSGTLHGLTRVRGFTQDDAHIFCREDQVESEIINILNLTFEMFKDFGFKDLNIYVSTRPEGSIGSNEVWEKAINVIKKSLENQKLEYQIDEGGGAFYGPKIDIKVKDALGREWQLTTVQIDFNLPERFDVNYIDTNGEKKRAIMIHRAILGSIERFIGVLLEFHGGQLPLWLAPMQCQILPVSEKHIDYAKNILEKLSARNIRCELIDENESVSKKIRNGEIQKIPYLLVVGDKEVEAGKINVRDTKTKEENPMEIKEFIELF